MFPTIGHGGTRGMFARLDNPAPADVSVRIARFTSKHHVPGALECFAIHDEIVCICGNPTRHMPRWGWHYRGFERVVYQTGKALTEAEYTWSEGPTEFQWGD